MNEDLPRIKCLDRELPRVNLHLSYHATAPNRVLFDTEEKLTNGIEVNYYPKGFGFCDPAPALLEIMPEGSLVLSYKRAPPTRTGIQDGIYVRHNGEMYRNPEKICWKFITPDDT